MRHKEFLIGPRPRLRFKLAGDDVEHRLDAAPGRAGCKTLSTCSVEPLVRIRLCRPRGSFCDGLSAPSPGSAPSIGRMIESDHIGEIIVGRRQKNTPFSFIMRAWWCKQAVISLFWILRCFLRWNLEPRLPTNSPPIRTSTCCHRLTCADKACCRDEHPGAMSVKGRGVLLVAPLSYPAPQGRGIQDARGRSRESTGAAES